MLSGYAGTVTFSGADGTVAGFEDHSSVGWFTLNMNLTSQGLTIDTNANISGTGTFTLAGEFTGSITAPTTAGMVCILSCADFIVAGTLSASGNIYLGNGTTGTSFLTVANGGTLNLTDNGSFAGSGSSNVRLGSTSVGQGGVMELAVDKTWTSGVSVYLRTAGNSDNFKIDDGATFDFSGTTFNYNGYNNVCLAVDGAASGIYNYVSLYAGATLKLYNNAVVYGDINTRYTATVTVDTIGSHSGNNATLIMGNGSILVNGAASTQYYGTLDQNTAVSCLNGTEYDANATFLSNVWYIDYWTFGSSYNLTLGAGSGNTIIDVAGSGLPNPYGTNEQFITAPNVFGNGNYTPMLGNDNGWSIG
jgi:hypothetical protein